MHAGADFWIWWGPKGEVFPRERTWADCRSCSISYGDRILRACGLLPELASTVCPATSRRSGRSVARRYLLVWALRTMQPMRGAPQVEWRRWSWCSRCGHLLLTRPSAPRAVKAAGFVGLVVECMEEASTLLRRSSCVHPLREGTVRATQEAWCMRSDSRAVGVSDAKA